MNKFFRSTYAGALLIVTLIFFTILQAESNTEKSSATTELRIATAQEFDTLNKMMSTMIMSVHIGGFTNRALARPDHSMTWQTQLAEKIPSIENKLAKFVTLNGKKKIVATWTIKENAKWGDGIPVTCRDFQFTLEVANNPLVPVSNKRAYDIVEKIEFDPKKPKVCSFIFAESTWDFFKLGEFVPLPAHIEGPVYEKYKNEKEGYSKNTVYSKSITTPGLYNGPYLITDYKPGNYLIFEPNPYFYGSPAKIKRIVLRIIQNTGTIEANLRTQDVNMSLLGMTLDQLQDFEPFIKKENLPLKLDFYTAYNYEHLVLDLENEFLKDINIRKALIHGTNRDQINKSFFAGKQTPAIHYVPQIDPWAATKKQVPTYDYSLKKANSYLDKAGWKMGADGVREKNGKKLVFNFMTTAGNKVRENIQVYLKEEWKKIGVDVQIKNEPPRTFFGETVKKRAYNGILLMAVVTQPENSLAKHLHSSNIPTSSNSYVGANWGAWKNPQADQLLDKIDQEFNAKKRIELAHQLQKMYMEDIVAIPLYFRTEGSLIPSNMTGYIPTGHFYSETNSAENWTLEPREMK